MLEERTGIVNHTDKLKKGSKNRINFYKNENKVLHFIRNNQWLIFRMRNSKLSGTSTVELGSQAEISLQYSVNAKKNVIILGCKKQCESLDCLQQKV